MWYKRCNVTLAELPAMLVVVVVVGSKNNVTLAEPLEAREAVSVAGSENNLACAKWGVVMVIAGAAAVDNNSVDDNLYRVDLGAVALYTEEFDFYNGYTFPIQMAKKNTVTSDIYTYHYISNHYHSGSSRTLLF